MNLSVQLPEKIRIASSFGNAAATYDRYAHFQRDIAGKLFNRISSLHVNQILDLGSGTGYCAEHMAAKFPGASISNLDIAEGMLGYAKRKGDGTKESWVCGDAEALPFRENCFDLVVSNLAMQWCPAPGNIFSELFRVMKPGSHAYISTLAENTLSELRAGWASVDSDVHVNSFLSFDALQQILNAYAFSTVSIQNHPEQYFYDSLKTLGKELKGIGATNLNAGQAAGLTGKKKLARLKSCFEQNRVPGKGIPVTYDLVLIELVK